MNNFDYTNLDSVMADRAHDNTSNKYRFIPTFTVIDLLKNNGWYVSSARQTAARKNHGFQKHIIRFRRQEDIGRRLEVNEIVPEAVLKTSHDGTTQFELNGGFQRCWCDNQCTVSAGTVKAHKIKHVGYTDGAVLDAINGIAQEMPRIIDKMHELKAIILTSSERYAFGSKAIDLMFDNDKWLKYSRYATIKQLITPTRAQDQDSNLWNLFNIIQEKFIKGGDFLISHHLSGESYKNYISAYGGDRTRGIKSIDREQKLNKDLWELTVNR
jgi:hypothetical protein